MLAEADSGESTNQILFTLDKSIDTASIQASYENGILNIHIAKKAEEPKVIQQIEIK